MATSINASSNGTTKRDLYQEATNRIIEKLEQGVAPWKCTWNKYGLARNASTGHIYTGINMLLMNCTRHPIPYFLTFKQAQKGGGKVKKGAKSEQIYYYNVYYKDADDKNISQAEAQILRTSGKQVKVNSYLKYYNVFNIDDVEGIDFKLDEVKAYNNPRIDECDEIIQNMPNAPRHKFINANQPYYSPIGDVINMPDINQFENSAEFYATYFHELLHSTGHQTRLNRPGITDKNVKFKDKTYSEEELIAETGASFLCAHTNIDYDSIFENSTAYLQGWLKVLKQDKRMIFKAAAEASKAVDLILNKT